MTTLNKNQFTCEGTPGPIVITVVRTPQRSMMMVTREAAGMGVAAFELVSEEDYKEIEDQSGEVGDLITFELLGLDRDEVETKRLKVLGIDMNNLTRVQKHQRGHLRNAYYAATCEELRLAIRLFTEENNFLAVACIRQIQAENKAEETRNADALKRNPPARVTTPNERLRDKIITEYGMQPILKDDFIPTFQAIAKDGSALVLHDFDWWFALSLFTNGLDTGSKQKPEIFASWRSEEILSTDTLHSLLGDVSPVPVFKTPLKPGRYECLTNVAWMDQDQPRDQYCQIEPAIKPGEYFLSSNAVAGDDDTFEITFSCGGQLALTRDQIAAWFKHTPQK